MSLLEWRFVKQNGTSKCGHAVGSGITNVLQHSTLPLDLSLSAQKRFFEGKYIDQARGRDLCSIPLLSFERGRPNPDPYESDDHD